MIVLISQHTRVRNIRLSTLWVKTEKRKERMIVGEREESKNPLPLDLWDHRCTSAIVTRPTAKTDTLIHPGEEGVKKKTPRGRDIPQNTGEFAKETISFSSYFNLRKKSATTSTHLLSTPIQCKFRFS